MQKALVSDKDVKRWVYDGLVNEILARAIQETHPELILEAQRAAEAQLKGVTLQQIRWAAMMKLTMNIEYGARERLLPLCGGQGDLLDWIAYAKKNGIRGDERL